LKWILKMSVGHCALILFGLRWEHVLDVLVNVILNLIVP
jgi:hypothetical protein